MPLVGSTKPRARAGLGVRPRRRGVVQPNPTMSLGRKAYKPPTKPGLGAPPAQVAPAPRPAPPAGQHMEPDPAYLSRIDIADRKEARSLGDLDTAERGIRHDFGIDDPTNPFSRAEGLKQAFLARRKAASAGLASQGQLYSGAHERALSRTRNQEEAARAELRRTYEGAIGEVGEQRAGVKFATEEERAQAFEDWLARAPEADYVSDPSEGEIESEVAAEDADESTAPADRRPRGEPPKIGNAQMTPGEAKRLRARLERKHQKIVGKAQERHQQRVVTPDFLPSADAADAPAQHHGRPRARHRARQRARHRRRH